MRSDFKSNIPLIVTLLATVGMCGCVIEQELIIGADGTGTSTVTITLHPAVVAYIDSLIDSFGAQAGTELFDVALIRSGIESRAGMRVVEIESPDRSTLIMRLEISDIELAAGGIATLSQSTNGSTRLDLMLSRTTFLAVSSLFVDDLSPAALFVPVVPSDFLPADDYLELVHYVLAGVADESTINEMVDDSSVAIAVDTKGLISSVEGGSAMSGQAFFTIPLIDAVTLPAPIRLQLEWRE